MTVAREFDPAVTGNGMAGNVAGRKCAGAGWSVAVIEGKVAASNMLTGGKVVPDYRGIPSVMFTIPEIVRPGMLKSEADAARCDYRLVYTQTGGWFSNFRIGESTAAAKILIDNKSDEILGAHLIGPEYAELINFLSLAMRPELTSGDLRKWWFPIRRGLRTSLASLKYSACPPAGAVAPCGSGGCDRRIVARAVQSGGQIATGAETLRNDHR